MQGWDTVLKMCSWKNAVPPCVPQGLGQQSQPDPLVSGPMSAGNPCLPALSARWLPSCPGAPCPHVLSLCLDDAHVPTTHRHVGLWCSVNQCLGLILAILPCWGVSSCPVSRRKNRAPFISSLHHPTGTVTPARNRACGHARFYEAAVGWMSNVR